MTQIVPLALVVATGLSLAPAAAIAASPRDAAPAPASSPAQTLGVGVMGGIQVPDCGSSCPGALSTGPSLGALVLYQPSRVWGFGASARVAKSHFKAPYASMSTPDTYYVDSDLTTTFFALAVRSTLAPHWVVSPLLALDVGVMRQALSGGYVACYGDAYYPTVRVGAGLLARLSPQWSAFGLGSITTGNGTSGQCRVTDGPPRVPFGGWGVGAELGVGFDLGLSAAPARNLASR